MTLTRMVCGNVAVDGGQLYIRGMIDGDVMNLGGVIHLFGSIHGELRELSGTTNVAEYAVIRP